MARRDCTVPPSGGVSVTIVEEQFLSDAAPAAPAWSSEWCECAAGLWRVVWCLLSEQVDGSAWRRRHRRLLVSWVPRDAAATTGRRSSAVRHDACRAGDVSSDDDDDGVTVTGCCGRSAAQRAVDERRRSQATAARPSHPHNCQARSDAASSFHRRSACVCGALMVVCVCVRECTCVCVGCAFWLWWCCSCFAVPYRLCACVCVYV
jgi:hypothetical protein